MSIVSGKKIKIIVLIVTVIMVAFSVTKAIDYLVSTSIRHKSQITNSECFQKAIVFIPNSTIEQIVKLQALKSDVIYDHAIYDLLRVILKRSTTTKKEFVIELMNKENFMKITSKGQVELDKEVSTFYTNDNIKQLEGKLEKRGLRIYLSAKNIANESIKILNTDASTLKLKLIDANINLSNDGPSNISFTSSGILVDFNSSSNGSDNSELSTYFDQHSEYQNFGITVVYPYSFFSSVVSCSKIYFETNNPMLNGTFIKKLSVIDLNDSEVTADFTVNNLDQPLFLKPISGQWVLGRKQNNVKRVSPFSYNADGLSPSQQSVMETLIKVCNDSIGKKVIDFVIAPTVTNTDLKFFLENDSLTTKIRDSRISYFNNKIIYKINLRYAK